MKINYKNSGVNIERGNNFISIIKDVCKNDKIGGFSGIYEHNGIKLVASTDGVGSKLQLCKMMNKYDTIGIDLVAMCVNDIICQGAKPLFFLDYYAINKLDLDKGKDIISGINEGCNQANCILLGGETAELPLLYRENDFDLAGFSVGIIERDIYPKKIVEGDLIYGLKSSGIHSNGYSLINKLLETHDYDLNKLMIPTKIYVNEINILKSKYEKFIKGFSHITGGGLIDNIPRILEAGYNFSIKINEIPEVFKWIYDKSDMSITEMFQTFNCGIGMVIIFDKSINCEELLGEDLIYLGEIIKSDNYIINCEKNIFK